MFYELISRCKPPKYRPTVQLPPVGGDDLFVPVETVPAVELRFGGPGFSIVLIPVHINEPVLLFRIFYADLLSLMVEVLPGMLDSCGGVITTPASGESSASAVQHHTPTDCWGIACHFAAYIPRMR